MSDIKVVLFSSSYLSFSITRATSFPHFGYSKTRWGSLQGKHEIFYDVSSFLSFPLSLNVVFFSCQETYLGLRHYHYHLTSPCLVALKTQLIWRQQSSMRGLALVASLLSSWPIPKGHQGNRRVGRALPYSESPRVALRTPWHTPEFDHLCAEGIEAWPYLCIRHPLDRTTSWVPSWT